MAKLYQISNIIIIIIIFFFKVKTENKFFPIPMYKKLRTRDNKPQKNLCELYPCKADNKKITSSSLPSYST